MDQKKKPSTIGACQKCGKLVVLNKFTLCYDCRREERQQVEKALDFLKTHRGASLNIIADATGVDPQIILRLIRGGRMETQSKENMERAMGQKHFRKKPQ